MNKKYFEPELKIIYFDTDAVMDVIEESKNLNSTNLFEGKETQAVTGISLAEIK